MHKTIGKIHNEQFLGHLFNLEKRTKKLALHFLNLEIPNIFAPFRIKITHGEMLYFYKVKFSDQH